MKQKLKNDALAKKIMGVKEILNNIAIENMSSMNELWYKNLQRAIANINASFIAYTDSKIAIKVREF